MRGSASRGEPRKAEIVAAALDLFVERGFRAVTLDDVARRAGTSKSTISRFFNGRSGLVDAALALELTLVFGELETASGDLAQFAEQFQTIVFAPRCLRLLQFVVGDSSHEPELGEVFRSVVLAPVIALVSPAVARAAGTEGDAAGTAAAADRFLGELLGLEILRALTGQPVDQVRLAGYRANAHHSTADRLAGKLLQ